MTTPAPVKRSELDAWRMLDGNELFYPIVIDDRTVKEWIGVGWIDLRRATTDDLAKYPLIED